MDGDGRRERTALSRGCKDGVAAVLALVLLWQQASEAGGRVELQLEKQVKAAADIREGTSSEERGRYNKGETK